MRKSDFADVDWYVQVDLIQRIEDQASLGAGAAAELHEGGTVGDEGGKLRGDIHEKGRLRSGYVVFRQFADGLEQPRAFGVVEVLAGQGLSTCRKASEHVVEKATAD
jgi:hypothetical protein